MAAPGILPVTSHSAAPADAPLGLVLAGWVLSLAVIAGLAWSAYAWRAQIMHAWPPSERVYAALGLA